MSSNPEWDAGDNWDHPALLVDVNDNIYLMARKATVGTLEISICTNAASGSPTFSTMVVIDGGNTPGDTPYSLVMDSAGKIHIAWIDTVLDIFYMMSKIANPTSFTDANTDFQQNVTGADGPEAITGSFVNVDVATSGTGVLIMYTDNTDVVTRSKINNVKWVHGSVTINTFTTRKAQVRSTQSNDSPSNVLMLYRTSGNQPRARFSTDLGVTWGSEETVVASARNMNAAVYDNGEYYAAGDVGGSDLKWWIRNGGSWTEGVITSITPANTTRNPNIRWQAFNHHFTNKFDIVYENVSVQSIEHKTFDYGAPDEFDSVEFDTDIDNVIWDVSATSEIVDLTITSSFVSGTISSTAINVLVTGNYSQSQALVSFGSGKTLTINSTTLIAAPGTPSLILGNGIHQMAAVTITSGGIRLNAALGDSELKASSIANSGTFDFAGNTTNKCKLYRDPGSKLAWSGTAPSLGSGGAGSKIQLGTATNKGVDFGAPPVSVTTGGVGIQLDLLKENRFNDLTFDDGDTFNWDVSVLQCNGDLDFKKATIVITQPSTLVTSGSNKILNHDNVSSLQIPSLGNSGSREVTGGVFRLDGGGVFFNSGTLTLTTNFLLNGVLATEAFDNSSGTVDGTAELQFQTEVGFDATLDDLGTLQCDVRFRTAAGVAVFDIIEDLITTGDVDFDTNVTATMGANEIQADRVTFNGVSLTGTGDVTVVNAWDSSLGTTVTLTKLVIAGTSTDILTDGNNHRFGTISFEGGNGSSYTLSSDVHVTSLVAFNSEISTLDLGGTIIHLLATAGNPWTGSDNMTYINAGTVQYDPTTIATLSIEGAFPNVNLKSPAAGLTLTAIADIVTQLLQVNIAGSAGVSLLAMGGFDLSSTGAAFVDVVIVFADGSITFTGNVSGQSFSVSPTDANMRVFGTIQAILTGTKFIDIDSDRIFVREGATFICDASASTAGSSISTNPTFDVTGGSMASTTTSVTLKGNLSALVFLTMDPVNIEFDGSFTALDAEIVDFGNGFKISSDQFVSSDIHHCKFTSTSNPNAINAAAPWSFFGCYFVARGLEITRSGPDLLISQCLGSGTASTWISISIESFEGRILDCSFLNATGPALRAESDVPPGTIRNSAFSSSGVTDVQVISGARVELSNCYFSTLKISVTGTGSSLISWVHNRTNRIQVVVGGDLVLDSGFESILNDDAFSWDQPPGEWLVNVLNQFESRVISTSRMKSSFIPVEPDTLYFVRHVGTVVTVEIKEFKIDHTTPGGGGVTSIVAGTTFTTGSDTIFVQIEVEADAIGQTFIDMEIREVNSVGNLVFFERLLNEYLPLLTNWERIGFAFAGGVPNIPFGEPGLDQIDYSVEVLDVDVGSNEFGGVMFGRQDSTNFYEVYLANESGSDDPLIYPGSGTQVVVRKIVDGIATVIDFATDVDDGTPITFDGVDTLRITRNIAGFRAIEVFVNGVQVKVSDWNNESFNDFVTDTTFPIGMVGLVSQDTRLDNMLLKSTGFFLRDVELTLGIDVDIKVPTGSTLNWDNVTVNASQAVLVDLGGTITLGSVIWQQGADFDESVTGAVTLKCTKQTVTGDIVLDPTGQLSLSGVRLAQLVPGTRWRILTDNSLIQPPIIAKAVRLPGITVRIRAIDGSDSPYELDPVREVILQGLDPIHPVNFHVNRIIGRQRSRPVIDGHDDQQVTIRFLTIADMCLHGKLHEYMDKETQLEITYSHGILWGVKITRIQPGRSITTNIDLVEFIVDFREFR